MAEEKIISRVFSAQGRENYDNIFRKKSKNEVLVHDFTDGESLNDAISIMDLEAEQADKQLGLNG